MNDRHERAQLQLRPAAAHAAPTGCAPQRARLPAVSSQHTLHNAICTQEKNQHRMPAQTCRRFLSASADRGVAQHLSELANPAALPALCRQMHRLGGGRTCLASAPEGAAGGRHELPRTRLELPAKRTM